MDSGTSKPEFISVIVPVYNSEASLPALAARLNRCWIPLDVAGK